MGELGRSFAEAFGRKDADALRALLKPDVDFRGLTPGRFWDSNDAAEVVDILVGLWLEESDVVTEIAAIETGAVGRRERVGYRFVVTNADGVHEVEQQAYLEGDGGRIGWLRVLCSGFQPMD